MDKLITVVGFILAISIASERLVEIIKGIVPYLRDQKPDTSQEGIRRSLLQILAVFSGVFTALLAKDALPPEINNLSIFILGLLASGGSGFWNAILTYISGVKDLNKVETERIQKNLPQA